MGLVFGRVWQRTDRLWVLVGAHALIDVVAFAGYALLRRPGRLAARTLASSAPPTAPPRPMLRIMGILDGKVVIVTGAGRGIGRGEALECAAQGAAVVVGEFDPDAGEAVAQESSPPAGGPSRWAGTWPTPTSPTTLGRGPRWREFGGLDALVNNAASYATGRVAKTDRRGLGRGGPGAPARALPAHPGRGAVLEGGQAARRTSSHTTSTSGLLGNFGQSNYGAAKAGIAAFSTIVATEGARGGITSNADRAHRAHPDDPRPVARRVPGAAATRRSSGASSTSSRRRTSRRFVAFLCSDAAAHISGKVFGVQGDSVEIFQPFT